MTYREVDLAVQNSVDGELCLHESVLDAGSWTHVFIDRIARIAEPEQRKVDDDTCVRNPVPVDNVGKDEKAVVPVVVGSLIAVQGDIPGVAPISCGVSP